MNALITRFKSIGMPFWLIVVLPTVLSILYFGLFASDRYVSVSSFVVRSPQKSASVSGLSAFLQNVGFSRSADDSYVVNNYVTSRDALFSLENEINLRAMYKSPKIDFLSRFDPLGYDDSAENFHEYYLDKVKMSLESASSISTLTVKAYTAEDAFMINEKLLQLSEALVNRLNERGRQDMISSSEKNLQEVQDRVNKISNALLNYRAANQVFDVEKQSTMQMQLVSKLQDQLILVKAQLAQVRSVTPQNPQIKVLIEREAVIKKEIEKETQKILGTDRSLNQKSAQYEKLMLEKDVAVKQLASALSTLEQNKAEADKKQIYLERISQPQKPDSAMEPLRIKGILSTFFLSLIVLGIFKMMAAGIREHQE